MENGTTNFCNFFSHTVHHSPGSSGASSSSCTILHRIRALAAVPAVRKSASAMFGLNTVEANVLTIAMVLLAMGMAWAFSCSVFYYCQKVIFRIKVLGLNFGEAMAGIDIAGSPEPRRNLCCQLHVKLLRCVARHADG